MENRKVVLDTETTGFNSRRNGGTVADGHRIIEIGCVEMIGDRITGNRFHAYVKPDRAIDPKAIELHGITDQFLQDKPSFKDIAGELIKFIGNSTVVIHNAPFDIAFLDQEFKMLPEKEQPIGAKFTVIDTLDMARRLFPGENNSLDSLGELYNINLRNGRHGALTDAQMLARIFIIMSHLNG